MEAGPAAGRRRRVIGLIEEDALVVAEAGPRWRPRLRGLQAACCALAAWAHHRHRQGSTPLECGNAVRPRLAAASLEAALMARMGGQDGARIAATHAVRRMATTGRLRLWIRGAAGSGKSLLAEAVATSLYSVEWIEYRVDVACVLGAVVLSAASSRETARAAASLAAVSTLSAPLWFSARRASAYPTQCGVRWARRSFGDTGSHERFSGVVILEDPESRAAASEALDRFDPRAFVATSGLDPLPGFQVIDLVPLVGDAADDAIRAYVHAEVAPVLRKAAPCAWLGAIELDHALLLEARRAVDRHAGHALPVFFRDLDVLDALHALVQGAHLTQPPASFLSFVAGGGSTTRKIKPVCPANLLLSLSDDQAGSTFQWTKTDLL